MSLTERVNNIKDDECVVDVLLTELSVNECKECGKCVYGYEGITQLEMILNDLAEKKAQSADMELMGDLGELIKTQSMCEVGEDLGEAILLSIATHGPELTDHIQKRECKAGVCKKFMTFHILASKCTGCGECLSVCEDDAILGKKNYVHVIKQNECLQCGKCLEECDCDAIVMAGKDKPKTPRKPIPVRRKKK